MSAPWYTLRRVSRLFSVTCHGASPQRRIIHTTTTNTAPASTAAAPTEQQSNDNDGNALSSSDIPPSLWNVSSPFQLTPDAASRLRRRRPRSVPLSSLSYIDDQQQLHYITSPADPPKRQYQLSVPALHTAYTFRITHAAKEYIHQASLVFEEQANKLNLYLKSIVPLPTKRKRWTLLRSPHVDKQAVEQFEIRTHKRLVTIVTNSDHEELQCHKLTDRCAGMISERVTKTMKIPAHTLIHTMTFKQPRGKIALQDQRDAAKIAAGTMMEDDDDPWDADEAFEDEDIGLELGKEDDLWGEEDEPDEDDNVTDVSSTSKRK